MAELPELSILQRQMDEDLRGRRVALVELRQEKCANVTAESLAAELTGRTITGVSRRGKWLIIRLDPEKYLLLNLGMGAALWHYAPGAALPDRYMLRVGLDDGSGFTCRFWWFGYVRLLSGEELAAFGEIARLGPSPLDIPVEEFMAIARRMPRKTAKSLILDQDQLSGIGNAYAHDILWTARLHPQRKRGALSDDDLRRYHEAIRSVLCRAIGMGGLEPDFHNSGGNLQNWDALGLVGYKEDRPCPECGTAIEKIKTGSTATYICPRCQPLGEGD